MATDSHAVTGVLAEPLVMSVLELVLVPVSAVGGGSGVVEESSSVYGGNSYVSDFT